MSYYQLFGGRTEYLRTTGSYPNKLLSKLHKNAVNDKLAIPSAPFPEWKSYAPVRKVLDSRRSSANIRIHPQPKPD